MKRYLIVGILLLFHLGVKAQERITSNHFFLNPYIYNPAYAGINGQAVLSLNHRQQWRGIEDAPVTTLVSFDIPITGKLLGGTKIINDQKSILNTTSAYLTLGYKVPLSNKGENSLSFGLSVGLMEQSIDSDEIYDYSDPAIIALFNTKSHILSEFGLCLKVQKLTLGLSLPTLLDPVYTTSELNFKPFSDLLLMGSYTFTLKENALVFEPYLLVRKEANTAQIETTGIFKFYNVFWVGGVYRQKYGSSVLAGLNIGKNTKLGYAYEMATSQVNSYASGSHEIQLSLYFDVKRKKPPTKDPRFKY